MKMKSVHGPAKVVLVGTIGLVAVLLVAAVSLKTLSPQGSSGSSVGIGMPGFAPTAVSPSKDAMMGGEFAGRAEVGDSIMMPVPYPPSAGQTAAQATPRVIRTGNLSVVVDDVREAVSRITAMASGRGGFLQDSSVQEREDGTHFGNLTVRVPVKEFDAAMEDIRKVANVVESETVSGQDVTEQFTDLQAHLKNAKAQEASYLEILKRAVSIEDVLAVQRELFNVRAQIESLEGQIQYLENHTDYSTISVFLTEEPSISVPTKEFRPLASAREAVQALVAIGQNLLLSLIYLVIIGGGLLIPVALVAWIVVRIVLHFLRRR